MGRPAKNEAWHNAMDTVSEAAPATDSLVPAGRPTCPRDLSPDARKKFRALCRQLAERRALTKGDGELLQLYAELFDRRARCMAKVKEQGEIVQYESRDRNNNAIFREKKNLNLVIAQESEKQMLAILVQLGLTPLQKDRPKMGAAVKPEFAPGTIGYMLAHGENDGK